MSVSLGSSFGEAFCERFGLDPGVVGNVVLEANIDELLYARPMIFVTAEDLEAIAMLMKHKETQWNS